MKAKETIINIGTDKKNYTGIRINKPFKDITYNDIISLLKSSYGVPNRLRIQGWCDVTNDKKYKSK